MRERCVLADRSTKNNIKHFEVNVYRTIFYIRLKEGLGKY